MNPIDWARIWGWITTFLNLIFWQSFISEVIAVFIGVISALWINEWNERRKDKEKRMRLLDEIASEIAENSNNMFHWRGLPTK